MAFAAIVGGVFLAADVVLHLFVKDTLLPAELAGLPHEAWHVPGILGLPLALLGLVAIYLRQSHEAGGLGWGGSGLLVLGMTVGAIHSAIFHGLFLPAIDSLEVGFFERLVDNTTPAQFYRGVVVQGLGLSLGAILFGSATVRSRVFPAAAGWVFIAAAVLAAVNQVWADAQLISRSLFAIAFIWLGLQLTSEYSST